MNTEVSITMVMKNRQNVVVQLEIQSLKMSSRYFMSYWFTIYDDSLVASMLNVPFTSLQAHIGKINSYSREKSLTTGEIPWTTDTVNSTTCPAEDSNSLSETIVIRINEYEAPH